MKAALRSFAQLMHMIRRDMMLVAVCLVPLLLGCILRFAVPTLSDALQRFAGLPGGLAPYEGLLDVFYAMMTPAMFGFAAAMVLLEERDTGIAQYLCITPLGRQGYFLSRLLLPVGVSLCLTALLLPLFLLVKRSMGMTLLLCAAGTMQGLLYALCILAFSGNKLEGMALAKLASVPMLGAFAAYFVPGRAQYLAAFLPAFLLAKGVQAESPAFVGLAVMVSLLYTGLLFLQIKKKR